MIDKIRRNLAALGICLALGGGVLAIFLSVWAISQTRTCLSRAEVNPPSGENPSPPSSPVTPPSSRFPVRYSFLQVKGKLKIDEGRGVLLISASWQAPGKEMLLFVTSSTKITDPAGSTYGFDDISIGELISFEGETTPGCQACPPQLGLEFNLYLANSVSIVSRGRPSPGTPPVFPSISPSPTSGGTPRRPPTGIPNAR